MTQVFVTVILFVDGGKRPNLKSVGPQAKPSDQGKRDNAPAPSTSPTLLKVRLLETGGVSNQ